MDRLKGKVAIITGAAMGQGLAEAKLFAREGAKIVMTDIQQDVLEREAEQIRQEGGEVLTVVHDVSREEDWQHVVRLAVEQFGKIDILVNNAGVASRKNVEQETYENWKKVIDINAGGVFLGMKHVAAEMRKAGGGSIVNISSVYALIGVEGLVAYHASKGAVRSMTKTAAMDFARDKIRVNSVHPGFIITPMTEDLYTDPATLEWVKSVTPWPRLGNPEDVAYGALYLASDEASFVTGSELVIDGGWVAH